MITAVCRGGGCVCGSGSSRGRGIELAAYAEKLGAVAPWRKDELDHVNDVNGYYVNQGVERAASFWCSRFLGVDVLLFITALKLLARLLGDLKLKILIRHPRSRKTPDLCSSRTPY